MLEGCLEAGRHGVGDWDGRSDWDRWLRPAVEERGAPWRRRTAIVWK